MATFSNIDWIGMTLSSTGYDTTANTIIFSYVTLALDDEIQNRVLEELDRIYNEATAEGRGELSYIHDFPKFQYILAFLVSHPFSPKPNQTPSFSPQHTHSPSSTKSSISTPSSSPSVA